MTMPMPRPNPEPIPTDQLHITMPPSHASLADERRYRKELAIR